MVEFRDLGRMAYGECWELQQSLFEELMERKREGRSHGGYILMVEHPAVYTLGKSGKSENILFSEEQLKAIGAEYYHIDRGGDVTFHGEGQIVLYPILDLEQVGIGLKEYIWALEQAVIDTVAHWGVEAVRSACAAGVWIEPQPLEGNGMVRRNKICAIGVKSSRYITMHGAAMNVKTDLKYFDYINPCGFTDRGVTSLEVEAHGEISMKEVKALLLNNLIKILNVKIYKK
ncbi:MAG: lipoyl(octanoyl) transferase LipB [Rikenellaceae bacterium]